MVGTLKSKIRSKNGTRSPSTLNRSKQSGKKRTDKELILALQNHFRKLEMSNVQGFHFMDKNGNGIICVAEIVQVLKEAGLTISLGRAKELINRYTDDEEMGVPQYVRFMASAYHYEDGESDVG